MLEMKDDKVKSVNIVSSLPGREAEKVIAEEKKYLATGTKCWESPAVVERAEGVWFWDVDGNRLLDWTNGMVSILGHSHPQWVAACTDQLKKVVYFNSPDFPNRWQASLARELVQLTPGDFPKKVFFACSGTEAVEAALKVARIARGRNLIISWIGDFHGRTTGSLATTASKSVQRAGYTSIVSNAYALPFAYCYRCWYKLEYPSCELYCASVLERYFKTLIPPEDVAAIIFEPVQGEGGYVIPPRDFYNKIAEQANKYGILLIADEVQTCFGKSGYWFASEYFNIVPDIIVMAKGLANGAPMGAITFPSECDFPRQGVHSNTFGGQILSCVSSLTTINIIREQNLLQRVRELGNYFQEKLQELNEAHISIGDIRALGLLLGIEFVKDRKTREVAVELRDYIVKKCYEKGLLLLSCGESGVRITPAYVITKDEIDYGVSILEEVITEAEKIF